MKFGEIWRESLDQPGLFRYSVIISPEAMIRDLDNVLTVPVVSKMKPWPTRISVLFQKRQRQLQCELIRPVAKSSFIEKVGELSLLEKAKMRVLLKQMLIEN